MISGKRIACLLFGLIFVAGCAQTRVTQESPMTHAGLARPKRIWVYDFVADPSQVPANSPIKTSLTSQNSSMSPADLKTGQQLGAAIANDLAAEINAMGLTAIHAAPGASPQVGDGVIRGYLVSVQGGSAAKRFVIGFGAGSSELDTIVEGYAVTPHGLEAVGSGTLSASGNKAPGMVAPAALAIATGSPIGVIVMGGAKIYGEASGKNTVEGRAQATAHAIAEQLRIRFRNRGWIS